MAAAKSTVGEKRAAARRHNRELRELISGLTNQQLKGFFGGFSTEDIERITKAIARVKEELRDDEIKAIEAQIKALEIKRSQLKG